MGIGNLNLGIYKVTKKVNKPIYNELDCIKRLWLLEILAQIWNDKTNKIY